MDLIVNLLLTACENTPPQGGVIVFLQSYGYKQLFFKYLTKHPSFERLSTLRKLFEEAKDGPDVFPDYQAAITK